MKKDVIEFYQAQSDQLSQYLPMTKNIEKIFTFARNVSSLANYRFILGVATWRRGGDPVPYLSEGLDVLEEHIPEIVHIDPAAASTRALHTEVAAVFAWLTRQTFSHEPLPEEINYPDGRLTALLLAELKGTPDRTAVNEVLKAFAHKKRHALAVKTFQNYFDILDRASAGQSLEDLVKFGSELYGQREHDAFYSGGPRLEGGGPGTDDLIDYRLGAVLKHVRYTGDSVHVWRW